MCNNTITNDPTTPQVCRYTTFEMSSVLKATIVNKTTSVTTHFKEINNREQRVYCHLLSKVIHILNFFYIKCSFCSPCCGTTHLRQRRHWPIDETLQQFAPFSDDCLLHLDDCRESSTLIDHLLKGTPNSAIDWIQIRAVWGPHVRLDKRDVLTPQVRRCVTARRPAADIRTRCQHYSCRMWQLL